jgi:hypothetical protein
MNLRCLGHLRVATTNVIQLVDLLKLVPLSLQENWTYFILQFLPMMNLLTLLLALKVLTNIFLINLKINLLICLHWNIYFLNGWLRKVVETFFQFVDGKQKIVN